MFFFCTLFQIVSRKLLCKVRDIVIQIMNGQTLRRETPWYHFHLEESKGGSLSVASGTRLSTCYFSLTANRSATQLHLLKADITFLK